MEKIFLAVPVPVWMFIGGVIGWFIGDLIKKSTRHEVKKMAEKMAVGTIFKVIHGDGSTDMLMEWDTYDYFNNLKTDHPVILNVKVEKRD